VSKQPTVNYTVKEILYEIKKDVSEVKKALDEHINDESNDIKELTKHVMNTNGRVKLNRWIATTALSLVMVAFGWILKIAVG